MSEGPREAEAVGAYRLVRSLGNGRRSAVWLARKATSGEEVALRLLHPNLVADTSAREAFSRRARRATEPRLGAVALGRDAGSDGDRMFAVARRVRGRTFAAFLAHERRPDPAIVLRLLEPVAATLDGLHVRGVAHGDLKATSILLALDGRGFETMLADGGDGVGPDDIVADLEALGQLVVRALAHELLPDDRRTLSGGGDPETGRRARSGRALLDAAGRATAPLPGSAPRVEQFWGEGRMLDRAPRRRRVVAALLISLAVIAGMAGLAASRSWGSSNGPGSGSGRVTGPGPVYETEAVSSTSEPGPESVAGALLDLVPVALRSACETGERSYPDSDVEVTCEHDGRLVRFASFGFAEEMAAAYRSAAPPGLSKPTVLEGPPGCARGEVEERAWRLANDAHAAGRYRCELDSNSAAITWTTDDVVVLGRAEAPDGDLGALFEWWRGEAGPLRSRL